MFDVIVAGSGAAGVQAAQTLVEKGLSVGLLDVGHINSNLNTIPPNKAFEDLRETEENQMEYFLGSNFESVVWDKVKIGAQLTPSRRYLIKDTDRWLPATSESFFPFESLAKGGLGGGWGAGCHVFSPQELVAAGLNYDELMPSYQKIVDRIGVSESHEDTLNYTTRTVGGLQKKIETTPIANGIIKKYEKNRTRFNKKGFYVGEPALALLSEDKGERRAHQYKGLEFYSDHEKSVYRPWMTLDELKGVKSFSYLPGNFIKSFKDTKLGVEVFATDVESGESLVFRAKKLMLCLGALGTGRVVLRSLPEEGNRVPILCNPYSYYPTISVKNLLSQQPKGGLSLAQILMAHDELGENSDVAIASGYTYKSLMLFRLVKGLPLGFREARAFFQFLQNSLMIFGVHHPDTFSKNKFMKIHHSSDEGGEPRFEMNYALSPNEHKKIVKREKLFCSAFRSLGCYPLKKVSVDYGASIHYAGTVPFSSSGQGLTTHLSGRLSGTQNVYIGDGSVLNFLPAKGVTLSLMAIADYVANNLVRS